MHPFITVNVRTVCVEKAVQSDTHIDINIYLLFQYFFLASPFASFPFYSLNFLFVGVPPSKWFFISLAFLGAHKFGYGALKFISFPLQVLVRK